MSLNECNRERVAQLFEGISAFDGSPGQLDSLQSHLQVTVGLFENDGSGVSELVRLAEADIEAIRFTRILEEQGEAAATRVALLFRDLKRLMSG